MNLNKENFWNPLREKYPEAVEHFCNWIDQYKKEIGWNELFGCSADEDCPIKFHDLPYEMQNGILARFDIEKFHGKLGYSKIASQERNRIENLFADVQRAINIKKIKYN